MTRPLFDRGETPHPSPGEVATAQETAGSPRLRVPQRNQVEMHWASLDELLEPDHAARLVWAAVCELDIRRWLCGGTTVNYHLLADFRSQGSEKWDDLLTQIVGSLLAENLVTMKRVAQDGMRVRASAGKASFRLICGGQRNLASDWNVRSVRPLVEQKLNPKGKTSHQLDLMPSIVAFCRILPHFTPAKTQKTQGLGA